MSDNLGARPDGPGSQASPSAAGASSPIGADPSRGMNEPDWFQFGKAFLRAVMFQRATRGVHVVGRDGRVRMGCVDLLGCYAVDDIAREFAKHAGLPFEDIEGPTEHEAMYMSLAGLRWIDWIERPAAIRAEARSGHRSKVDVAVLAQAIETRRAETPGSVADESAVLKGCAQTESRNHLIATDKGGGE